MLYSFVSADRRATARTTTSLSHAAIRQKKRGHTVPHFLRLLFLLLPYLFGYFNSFESFAYRKEVQPSFRNTMWYDSVQSADPLAWKLSISLRSKPCLTTLPLQPDPVSIWPLVGVFKPTRLFCKLVEKEAPLQHSV